MTSITNETNKGIADKNRNVGKIIHHLKEIRDICRQNQWYASATYASLAAESLFHMLHLGDKTQRPDMLVTLTDIHFADYPHESEDPAECDND